MTKEYGIRTENLQVGYGRKIVVDGVDLLALKGQMICLLGPNGAGKSTILRTLSGMLSPVRGSVYLDGENVGQMEKKNLARKMAVVLTERLSPGLLTAFDVVAMGRHPYTGFFGRLKEEDKKIVRDALESVNAGDLSWRYYGELSDGEKQKVMIARALAQQPELIVLDEPTSHLDIRHRVEVVNILQSLCREQKLTVILSLHDIDLAVKGCGIILLIKDGKIIAQGNPEQIVRKGMIQELYGITNARYNDLMGSLELCGQGIPQIFVTGGAGTGIPLYRAFTRAGYGICCGVLHENDIDAYVADAVAAETIMEEAFTAVTGEHEQQAEALMEEMQAVVDTGFPLREENQANACLLRQAVRVGKPVLSLREKRDADRVYGTMKDRIRFFTSVSRLVEEVKALF